MTDPSPVRRLTFLERRTDTARERFSWHWSTDHADIARRLPGMSVYEQNHTVRRVHPVDRPARAFVIDGIAESWYDGVDSIVAGVDSAAKHELLIDEPFIFSGLTGIMVPPYAAPRSPSWKLWLLGDESFDPTALVDVIPGAAFVHTSRRTDDVPTMTRQALRAMTEVPDIVCEIHLGSAEAAHTAADAVEEHLASHPDPHLAHALLTREVRIF